MAVGKYYLTILTTLQGRTDELRAIPPERLDWSGPGALLELFRKTSGTSRSALIRAIGQVIRNHPASPAVIAQLIDIASGLDLAEVEPQVRKLQAEPFASQEPLRGAIANYLAFRKLNLPPETIESPRSANGRLKTSEVNAERAAGPKSTKTRRLIHRKSAGG